MAVVDSYFLGFLEWLRVFEDEGAVVDGVESEKVKHNYRIPLNPRVFFPAVNIMKNDALFSGSFPSKAQPIDLFLVCDDMAHSLQRLIAGNKIDLSFKFLAEVQGEEEALRGDMFVADDKTVLIAEDLAVGVAHAKDGVLAVPLLVEHGFVYFVLGLFLSGGKGTCWKIQVKN